MCSCAICNLRKVDIVLADASQAIVIDFRVTPEDRAVTLAEDKKIEIRRYDIIYQVTDVHQAPSRDAHPREVKEVHLGRPSSARSAGSPRSAAVAAAASLPRAPSNARPRSGSIREGREIYKGSIESSLGSRTTSRKSPQNPECGIKIGNFDDIKNDDVIEVAYRIDIIRCTL